MDSFPEKVIGIFVAFALHVLRQRHADRAGFGRIGQHAHRADHGGHQLLRAFHPVPVFAYGLKCIIGGGLQACRLFHLLQNRVWLACGERVARKKKQGDVVDRR